VVSILKPGKDPTLPSSYRPISLLDTVGKLLEKILLNWVMKEVNESGLLRDEQFGFRPRLSTTLQLARLVERVNRNLDGRMLTGAVFLNVAKAFDIVWAEGLYKLTVLNFPSFLVKTISSYLQCRTFQATFQSATSTCRGMRPGVAQGGTVSPVPFSLYVNDMPTPSRRVELALYADNKALVATSRSPPYLLVSYLETYLCRLEHWLREWRISINVSKSTAMLFTTRHIQRPRPIHLLREPIGWVETARYLGVTRDTRLTWSAHII
jgi:hypothetical protein